MRITLQCCAMVLRMYMRALNFKSLLCNNTETLQLFCTCHIIVVIHYQQPRVFLEGFCYYISMTTLIRVYEIINSCSKKYYYHTKWKGALKFFPSLISFFKINKQQNSEFCVWLKIRIEEIVFQIRECCRIRCF